MTPKPDQTKPAPPAPVELAEQDLDQATGGATATTKTKPLAGDFHPDPF